MNESLRSLKTNERPWANFSGRSWQMSDREPFAQVAHDKWANERFAQKCLALYVFLFKKWVIRSFPLVWWALWANRSGRSPKMSDHEPFAQVAHRKWANGRTAHFFERIAPSLIFSQKTSDSLRKPMSEFTALVWRQAQSNPLSYFGL